MPEVWRQKSLYVFHITICASRNMKIKRAEVRPSVNPFLKAALSGGKTKYPFVVVSEYPIEFANMRDRHSIHSMIRKANGFVQLLLAGYFSRRWKYRCKQNHLFS